MSAPDIAALPGLPRDEGGPLFAEPWQAQAFALVVRLNAEGVFTWAEWTQALSRQIATDPGDDHGDDGSRYYQHWVRALEALATELGLAAPADLAARKTAWEDAYRRTPHGQPVELLRVN